MLMRVLSYVGIALMGVIVATVGTGSHRAVGYLGVSLALLLVALTAVFVKAWKSWFGFVVFAVSWLSMVIVYGGEGASGSVLIVDDLHGKLWLFGGAGLLAVIAAIPPFVLTGRHVKS